MGPRLQAGNRLKRLLNAMLGNKVFAVDFRADGPGFFAHLTWCLEVLWNAERAGLRPHIRVSTPYLLRTAGDNWLDYYFLFREPAPKPATTLTYRAMHIDDLCLGIHPNAMLDLTNAPRLFEKYLCIQDSILEKCDRFCREHFEGRTVLGVHYRGSDKMSATGEAPAIEFEKMRHLIARHLAENPRLDCLFVASDERAFVDYLEREIKSVPVTYRANTAYAQGRLPSFRTDLVGGDPYVSGEEALIDCLLLARCDTLIKTASILSGWSKIFNPRLRVIMASMPKDGLLWFPERCIAEEGV